MAKTTNGPLREGAPEPQPCPHTSPTQEMHVAWVGRDTKERNLFRCVRCWEVFLFEELPEGVIFDA